MNTQVLDQPLYFVGTDIQKESAHLAARDQRLLRLSQGIYVNPRYDVREAFNAFGMRIANKFYPDAALSHATAWYKRPVDDRLFIGGDYPYKRRFGGVGRDGSLIDCMIVQSLVTPDYTKPALYELVTIKDEMGSFQMHCPTLVVQILQQMDPSKVHPEKHIPEAQVSEMWELLQEEQGGRHIAADYIDQVAAEIGKVNQAERFFKRFYRRR